MTDDTIYYGQPVNPSHPLNRGRVAWWLAVPWYQSGPRFIDLCGKNHGTLTGGAAWASAGGRPGGWGAVTFDGSDDYVDAGASTVFDFGSGDFAVAAWVKLSSLTQTRGMIVGKDAVGARQLTLEWDANDNNTNVIRINYFTAGGSPVSTDTGANAIADLNWHRVLGQRVGSTLSIYLDGVAQSVTPSGSPGAMQATTTALRVGAREYAGFTDPLAATIDDVAVWSRSLSDDEARLDYNVSRQRYPGVLSRLEVVPFGVTVAGGATLEQLAYRFRDDDGSETTATALAAENTNITRVKLTNTRLRVQVDATGDAASHAMNLQYRKQGASTWRTIAA